MDVFKEFIVKKELRAQEKMSMALIMISSVALAFACVILTLFTVLRMIGFLLACVCVYGAWKLVTRFFLEYEYIVTNRDLDIDKIINQNSRKRLCTIDLLKVTEIGKCADGIDVAADETLVKASANNDELEDYYIRFDHKSYGKSVLLFTPSTELMEVILQSVPRNTKKSI